MVTKPDTKHLVLIASPDMHHPSHADLAAIASLRERIDPALIDQISVQVAPKLPGPLAAAKTFLGDGRTLAQTRSPNAERLDASYIGRTLTRVVDDSETAVLAIVPPDRLRDIAASLTRRDGRHGAVDPLAGLQEPAAPGAAVIVCHTGSWKMFARTTAHIVQVSPPEAECFKAAPKPGSTSRRPLPGSALLSSLFSQGARSSRPAGPAT